MSKIPFNSVTEWLAAGGMSTGFYLMEESQGETEKAVAFKCTKFTSYGNPYEGKGWLPKSQIKKIKNDFYIHGAEEMYLAPGWLLKKSGMVD